MQIPKTIYNKIVKRAEYASKILELGGDIDDFINKHNIDVEDYDRASGVEVYTSPYANARRILQAVKDHEEN